jgi:hypothetical protein
VPCAFVILATCLSVTSMALAAGCQQQTFSDQEKADIRASWNPGAQPAVAHPQSAVLIEGPAPLLYQAREPGTIHVTDSASGARLVTAAVQRGTVIRIDSEDGIFVGEQKLKAGPLTTGRRYGIVLDVDASGDWQSRIEAPKPAPPPPTRPANERSQSSF